ncbi:MAG TPA: GAF domain-containing SpoIIE family protein phosphatase, partial [Herpetosiphonaceae bacterium]
RCHLAQGRPQLARGYLGDARYAYERWGAAAIVARLDREFGELFAARQPEPGRGPTLTRTSVTSTTGGAAGRSLDLATVTKASRAIAGELVLGQLLSRLMQIMLENAGAQRGALLLEDKGRLLIQAYGEIDAEPAVLQALPLDTPAGAGLVSAAIVNYAARTREPLVLADAGAEGGWTRDPHVRERRARSVLCIPLINQGRLAALVYLENNLTAGAFTEDRVELLTLLAGEAAISLENARLYANLEHLVEERTAELRQANQTLRALTDRLQSELALAQTIQRSLLPAGAPDWPGAEVASHTQAAREVGGDFFTYHTLGAGRHVVAVGDVSGKGMPAALLMAVSLASLQAAVSPELGPAALLGRLDEALRPYTASSRLNCALCYAEFADGELVVANAGCIPPLIRRAGAPEGVATEWAEAGGLPLGVALGRGLGYRESRVGLRPGDLVVLSSDGIVEAQNRAGEMLGFERFEALVAAGPVAGAQALLNYLQAALAEFMAGAEPHDDLTLVVIRC